MIREATIEEIEAQLLQLGGGNHEDNMTQVRVYPNRYHILLEQDDFMDLVFLQVGKLKKIVPKGEDRRLRLVALRADALPTAEQDLGSNWNIGEMLDRFRRLNFISPSFTLCPLLLRDVRGSESKWAENGWYLQDGSHRALAYCMLIQRGEAVYVPQPAFCVTNRRLDIP